MTKNILYMVMAASLLFSSCAGELDTEPTGSSVSDEQLQALMQKEPETVLAAMVPGAINFMHDGNRRGSTNDRGFMVWNFGQDLQGNDMLLSSLSNWFADEYMFENLRGQTNALTADRWYCYYKIVYKANQILDLVKLVPEELVTDAVLYYKAQAITYRAFGYYYLMCIYQDDYMHGGKDKAGVPYYTTTEDPETGKNPVSGRTPSAEVFANITADLKTAIAMFEDCGCDPSWSTSDIDQDVANMVLARVAVTTGDYKTAKSAAAAVIASGYSLMNKSEYTESGFQQSSLPETIWSYTWSSATSLENRSFASWISLTAIDKANNKGVYPCIDERLYKQIPASDYRKMNFLAAAKGKYPAYANTKFNAATYRQDEIYMRLSEAYLLKAEAEARDGDSGSAQQTLYDLVSERDSGYTKSTKTGDALLNEIFVQSRIELWGEGHEFFTNKRFNVGVDRTSSTNHTDNSVKLAGKEFTYQIPLSIEINSNPFITSSDQNPL